MPRDIELPVRELFGRNVSVGGGVAPVRAYLPELLADVVAGTLDPSPVFDVELGLGDVARGLPRHARAPRHQGPAAPLSAALAVLAVLAECGLTRRMRVFGRRKSAFGE